MEIFWPSQSLMLTVLTLKVVSIHQLCIPSEIIYLASRAFNRTIFPHTIVGHLSPYISE